MTWQGGTGAASTGVPCSYRGDSTEKEHTGLSVRCLSVQAKPPQEGVENEKISVALHQEHRAPCLLELQHWKQHRSRKLAIRYGRETAMRRVPEAHRQQRVLAGLVVEHHLPGRAGYLAVRNRPDSCERGDRPAVLDREAEG